MTGMIGKEVMEGLRECVGETIMVKMAICGETVLQEGILVEVKDFLNIRLKIKTVSLEDGFYIPFIGRHSGIQYISGTNGILYENARMPDNYGKRDEKVFEIKVASFGREVAWYLLQSKDEDEYPLIIKLSKYVPPQYLGRYKIS